MTSRREFISNTFGIALVTASTWPIRAGQAHSTQQQSDTSTSKAGRTTRKTSLNWDVFLAGSIPAITSDLPPGETQRPWPPISSTRSEEHTSELQSRLHLVCRLLLEKKKTK